MPILVPGPSWLPFLIGRAVLAVGARARSERALRPPPRKRSKTTDDARRSLVASPESNPNEDQARWSEGECGLFLMSFISGG